MKTVEQKLRQIIREEIQKTLNEDFNGTIPDNMKGMLGNLGIFRQHIKSITTPSGLDTNKIYFNPSTDYITHI